MLFFVVTGSAHIQRLVATSGADVQGCSASQAMCGSYFAGDVIGARSILGGWKSEPASVVVRTKMLTLAMDRTVVASALPPDVVIALLSRTDELTISTSVALAAPVRFGSNAFDGEPRSVLKIERILARGTFGVVASAVHASTGVCYAVKRIEQSAMTLPTLQRQLLSERAALCNVAHPCVCRLFATHKNALALYLVMELCDGPELYDAIQAEGGLEEGRLVACASCIVAALGTLHERGWIYRDVKAENFVFMASGHLKLVDLGLARRMPASGRCFTVVGTCEYMAPEVIKQANGYNAGADWWGVGCLLYEMRYTRTPWLLNEHGVFDVQMSDTEVSRRILDVERPLEFPSAAPALSPVLASLVHDLLEHRPARRLGGGRSGSVAVRAHALFVDVDWAAVDAGTNKMPPASDATGSRGLGASVERSESTCEQRAKQEGGNGQDVNEVGDNDNIDTNLDPVSAQLMRFLKEKQASETSAPPLLSSGAERRQATSSSEVSLNRPFNISLASSSMVSSQVDSFWDGPEYEDAADAWDRQF
uniref:cGMP-dependent protein kinase n=1 Tax=Haptolina brevifila TaxID=156173 RepID=A0A7S2DPZ0_9EUKA|mmetsp:Transcript_42153/g.84621  ORF Transcript_42153/g.84621 Transcript_42153/m.84621 type:complete len:537 (+) Transcript_42153:345-1955(+)